MFCDYVIMPRSIEVKDRQPHHFGHENFQNFQNFQNFHVESDETVRRFDGFGYGYLYDARLAAQATGIGADSFPPKPPPKKFENVLCL